MGRELPAVPLRDPPVARGVDPRCDGGGVEPGPGCERRHASDRHPRAGADRPDASLGPRRAARRRYVELQLADLMVARSRRSGNVDAPTACGRSRSRLARGSGARAPPDRDAYSLRLNGGYRSVTKMYAY